MKPPTKPDKEEMILALQDEIRGSVQARYDHRLHGVLLVAEGLTCPAVANLLGDAPRTVEYWVHRFDAHGFAGLADGEKAGRPRRLSDAQVEVVETEVVETQFAQWASGSPVLARLCAVV
jgi:transposase